MIGQLVIQQRPFPSSQQSPPMGLLSFSQVEFLLDWFTTSHKTPGLNRNDGRLSSHEEVGGLRLNGAARAYPLTQLRLAGGISDTLGGVPLIVLYDSTADKLVAYRQTENGRPDLNHPLPVKRLYWLGWSEFQPDTTIYEPRK